MKRLLAITAVVELTVGVALVMVPSLVVRQLLSGELAGVGFVVARVTGIALLALGVACLPRSERGRPGATALCE